MKRLFQPANLRRWCSSPSFYLRRARWKFLGRNLDYLCHSRDDYPLGSPQWLALTELLYGGFQQGGAANNQCQGGDRMSPHHHNYAPDYARFLQPWIVCSRPLTLIEVGILNGNGLALWCDLFPQARVIGLDINLDNFYANLSNLKRLGAFSGNKPEVYSFNQLEPDQMKSALERILGTSTVDIIVDDGCHSLEAIQNTFQVFLPKLSSRFIYFIEDSREAFTCMKKLYPKFRWIALDELTIVQRGA